MTLRARWNAEWVLRPPVAPRLDAALLAGAVPELTDEPMQRALATLHQRGLLEWGVGTALVARPLASSLPMPVLEDGAHDRELSASAFMRRDRGSWVLESAASPWRVVGGDGLADRVSAGAWTDEEWQLLDAIDFTSRADARPALQAWSFHDRLFALRTRLDARHAPSPMNRGDRHPPPLRIERHPGAECVLLPMPRGPRPDEPSLWAAMEQRQTHRDFTADPVTIEALGEILARTVRERAILDAPGARYEAARKPVPSGGGLHAIDTWVGTTDVTGLDPAWWWYDPREHALRRAPGTPAPREVTRAPVELRFTVRHERASWKYAGFSHALELKDMGVIMLAFQLAAAPVGLGAWLVGSGPLAAFGPDLGIDIERDHPIGELLLGVLAER